MAYLDGILAAPAPAAAPAAPPAFPWPLVALERPELECVIRSLVAHGLLAAAVAAELQARAWLEDERLLPVVAAAIHAPLVAVAVGECDPATADGAARLAGHLACERALGAAEVGVACAACAVVPPAAAAFELHDQTLPGAGLPGQTGTGTAPPATLCARCHARAHGRTPPLLAAELRGSR
jgi:hypothetical protein